MIAASRQCSPSIQVAVRLVIAFDVTPVGLDKIAEPLIEIVTPRSRINCIANPAASPLVIVQDLHESCFVLSVLEIGKLVFNGRRNPLDGMTEQVEQQETLHFESDVGIDHDAKPIEMPVAAGQGRDIRSRSRT